MIVVDSAGENTIVVCPGAGLRIDALVAAAGLDAAVLAQLEVDMDVVEQVARRTTGSYFLDVSPVTDLSRELRDRVDLFTVNEGEYEKLPYLATASQVALTLGAEGAVLLRRGRVVAKARVPAERVVNTVGAGDALEAACRVAAVAVSDPHSQPTLSPLPYYAP